MSDTFAEISSQQNYDPTFLELKLREEQKTLQINHTNQENNNKNSSKEELTRAFQVTKNFAPGPDKIHIELFKHLPREGFDSILAIYNKIWQQGYFPENW